MKRHRIDGLVLWAAREVLGRSGDAVLTAVCLAAATAVLTTALLLSQAVSDTACRILSDSPSLVVRRIDAGGWAPIPIGEACSRIRSVPGVVSVRPRIWGAAGSENGPVTVVGLLPPVRPSEPGRTDLRPPPPGRAVVGPGIQGEAGRISLGLAPRKTFSFSIAERLPAETALAAQDWVLLDPADAGRVLGIAPGFASDLAVAVFHDAEAEALAPELAGALPWPVRITTRAEAVSRYSGAVFRRGSLAVLALVPAVLAVLLLVAATVRDRVSRRSSIGLLKSLGWQTADVVWLHLIGSAMIALPGVLAGAAAGYWLVFFPGVSWPSELLLGWAQPAPGLRLDPAGALTVLAEIGALVLVPYLAAAAVPVLRAALADPQDLLEEGN